VLPVRHTQPALFALPAGIGHVLVGLFALPIAFALASCSRGSRRAAIAWNVELQQLEPQVSGEALLQLPSSETQQPGWSATMSKDNLTDGESRGSCLGEARKDQG
jgi:hypothetical protein